MPKWLDLLFRRSNGNRSRAEAHMTFGQTSLGGTLSRTRLFLRKQLWIWPIVAVVLLSIVGYAISSSIERTMENTLRSELETLLTVEKSMLEKWLAVQESNAETLANSQDVREIIGQILAASDTASQATDETSPVERQRAVAVLQARLEKELEASMASHDFVGYVVASKQQQIVASSISELIGKAAPQYESFLARTLEGNPNVSVPFSSTVILKDSTGKMRSGVPTMFVCAPVRDQNLQVIAALALRIRPEKEFTEILQLGRIGETGETYAIDHQGIMVSNSRFDDGLLLLGLLPDEDDASSILKVQVRDPGGNMLDGFRPGIRRRELPLTEIAATAVSGTRGVNMEGYRDYRGSPAVGAWTWLPKYQMGIITEISKEEAYRPLTILKWSFYALYALLGISAVAIFVFTLIVAKLQRQAQKAAIEAKQLGQYRLKEKIGAGAMGVVYKGEHAMLRRPTAIKLLDVDRVNEVALQRFEREVQITCNLNNPHTVAIYDYGRTPEGVFYYAMEYLDGIDLQRLVDKDGPQPEGRVVKILRQICESLYEAHTQGLVHRDIKPANIMLNRRGAEPDVVKVLDFGLVKALDDKGSSEISGTPLYMSPEAIQTPDLIDPRSDLYAVGAVGYVLLTGQTVFGAQTLRELCQQQVGQVPELPSQRLGRPVSSELEHAIMMCLEKNRAKRPQTARDLAVMLDRVAQHDWSLDDAEAWWSRHDRGQPQVDRFAATNVSTGAASNSQFDLNLSASSENKSKKTAPALDRTTLFEESDDNESV
ncbi:MAG: serine/threonine protein kinase [Planctomycetota bacterium]|nr:serine/threonine protein kinase [Planctomycetota bacterium]